MGGYNWKSEPVFALAYGRSKLGKTSDLLYSFPDAMFLCGPGALKASARLVGYAPPNIQHAIDFAAVLLGLETAARRKIPFVVIDDLSLVCDNSMSRLETSLSGFKFWTAVRHYVLALRAAARNLGVHVIMNAHERAISTNEKGKITIGGPKLPGGGPEDLPAMADMVLQAQLGHAHPIWPVAYRSNLDPNWIRGDRLHVAVDPSPMNLGELFRAAGHDVPRPESLRWMDDAVAMGAEWFGSMTPVPTTALQTMFDSLVAAGRQPEHANWAVRDAYDRVLIARARTNRFRYGTTSLFGSGGGGTAGVVPTVALPPATNGAGA